MKRIAYTIEDNGVDGRDVTRIVGAYWEEDYRDQVFDASPDKSSFLRKSERIVDTDNALREARAKLNALDALVLGL